jgi:hypothetical protein
VAMVLMSAGCYEDDDEGGVDVPDELWRQLVPGSVCILALVDVVAGRKMRAGGGGRRGGGEMSRWDYHFGPQCDLAVISVRTTAGGIQTDAVTGHCHSRTVTATAHGPPSRDVDVDLISDNGNRRCIYVPHLHR